MDTMDPGSGCAAGGCVDRAGGACPAAFVANRLGVVHRGRRYLLMRGAWSCESLSQACNECDKSARARTRLVVALLHALYRERQRGHDP